MESDFACSSAAGCVSVLTSIQTINVLRDRPIQETRMSKVEAKLNDMGKNVKQIHYPSLFHSFINITRLKTAKLATIDIFREIKRNL